MRRGIRGKWNRPHQSFEERPRGLRGKEIGLYYRDAQRLKKLQNNEMGLKVPEPILAALQAQIAVIEDIAQRENIYLPPQKKLEFIKPDSSVFESGANFIPLSALESEKQSHFVTNIIPRDDDVIFIDKESVLVDPDKNKKSMKHSLSEDTSNAIKDDIYPKPFNSKGVISLDDDDTDIKIQPELNVKNESTSGLSDNVIDLYDDVKEIKRVKIENVKSVAVEDIKPVKIENVKPIKTEDGKPIKIDSDNNARQYEPCCSREDRCDNIEYKYGYDDIITGTFQEKLDESIAKGIAINIKNNDIDSLNLGLLAEYNLMKEDGSYKKMLRFRETLPAYKKAQDLLQAVNDNQVVVISGETGCGKSTQVPQIILDDAIKNKRGANVKILVTQPRRIAASSLAMRVAEERGEKMGGSVGYTVRLERVECRSRGSIMFCTTGVLLVEMETDQSLSNFSHIILDEVHERDCQIDISMCMLRQVLQKRKDLKLILMSATIDAETLCAYYDNCPLLHIEGLAFPVEDVYLEKILEMTKYQLPPKQVQNPNRRSDKPWMKHVRTRKNEEMEKEIQHRVQIGPWLESVKKTMDKDVHKTLQDPRTEELDINLIFELLLCICRGAPGAILVFLPGISNITKLIKIMNESRQFPSSQYEIHPLHSKLPTLTQHKIFVRPRGNIRKIIIATNIAETSITIDDIVYVVDCAKIKYSGLSVEEHVSTLQVEWASQANLRQRRGRAGRCQPGICYHLVTSYRASFLPERMLPELQRNNLLEPVLQIKRLRLGMADQALKMMPAVPDEKTIRNAVKHLQQCGALDEKETLTPLGWHLARLPVHPAAGKLLLLGALFGCLERAASVAAVWGFKDPFLLVIGKEREIDEAKKILALGEPSDHIAMSEALMQWERCGSQGNAFARDYFLSWNTLKLLSDMKKQFGNNLKQMGFLQSGDVRAKWENRNTDNLALFKAIVAASLYPNIGTVQWKNLKESYRSPKKAPYIQASTPEDYKVMIHPSSVMAAKHHRAPGPPLPLCAEPGANWLVYWLKQRSSELYLIDVTLVYTLPLLFFGEMNVSQAETSNECIISIRSIQVRCEMETTQILYQLRALLDQVLASKIMASRGGKRSSEFEDNVLNAVIRLITAEDSRTEYLE